MNFDSLKTEFKRHVCEQVELQPEGKDRYLVSTPFRFEDGDHFGIVLKRENGGWLFSDEATTLMHLSYQLDDHDLEVGNRAEIVDNCLKRFSIQNREGELVLSVDDEHFGDALYNFVQALSGINNVSYLSRERVRSTFIEDFRALLKSRVSEDRLTFDWTSEEHDPHKRYPVDARINGIKRPLLVYGLQNDEKVGVATICLLSFSNWGIPFQSMGVFEEQESISRKTLARFTDVCDKAFSSLEEENRERIAKFLDRILSEA
jgi:hypothetical protein